jgi:hypothetical protein
LPAAAQHTSLPYVINLKSAPYVIKRPKRLEKSGMTIELKFLCKDVTL